MQSFFETDIGVALQWTVFDAGKIADLTGASSVTLLVHGLAKTFPLTVVNALGGLVQYIIAPGDFPAGTYSANIEVVFPSPSRTFTTKTLALISKPLYGS